MPTISSVIANKDFELGDVGWVKTGGWSIVNGGGHSGPWCGHIHTDVTGGGETSEMHNENCAPCAPGTSITLSASVVGFGANYNVAAVIIEWLDASFVRISTSNGNTSDPGSHSVWEISTVTGIAPPGTFYARAICYANTVKNGGISIDDVSWNFTNDRTITLTSPTDTATYTEGDSVLLSVNITGTTPGIEKVVYKDGATTITETLSPDYHFNTTTLAVGVHVITADLHLLGGTIITSNAATITIEAIPIVLITREFKASNAYTYLVASNFSGLSKAMPLTARVTGVEILVDYITKILVRSKDIGVADPMASNPNVLFDTINGGVVEAILLSGADSTFTSEGTTLTSPIALVHTDFDVTETSTSEGKKWTVFEQAAAGTVTVGGDTSLFGLTTIAATDFIGRSIGLRFKPIIIGKPAYADSGDACIRFNIDKVRLRIFFDAGSAEYFFASADKTQVIKGELVSADVDEGDYVTGDATGELQLRPELEIRDGTQTWIGDDWTIHAAYPPNDANQIGTVAIRTADDGIGMSYNGLPSTQAVVENRSRYVFITANFFAVKALDSIYGATGLPRAFAYNGDFFYKIHTQPDPVKDQPRHVAYHHGHLALGYDDGRVDISVIGQPYNFDGALGASEWSIGDGVTGLLPLSGTILGIFGSKSIWGLNGTTVDNFATQVITPNIGAIEYTVTDMGFPVYANAYGVYTLAQTQQYGDYLGTPMSQDISPWLRPRLVRKYTSDKEVVVAWPVRSKNQYRLAFTDGYIVSMTLNSGQQTAPTFSFQQYTIYTAEDE